MAIYYTGGSWVTAGSGHTLLRYGMLNGSQDLPANPPSGMTTSSLLSYGKLWNNVITNPKTQTFLTNTVHGGSGTYGTDQLMWAQDAKWYTSGQDSSSYAAPGGSFSICEPGGIPGYSNTADIAMTVTFYEDQNDVDDGSVGGIMANKRSGYSSSNTDITNDFWGRYEWFVRYQTFAITGSQYNLLTSYGGKVINNSEYKGGRYPYLWAFGGTYFTPSQKAVYFTNNGYPWGNSTYRHNFSYGHDGNGRDSEGDPIGAWVWGRGSMYHVGCVITMQSYSGYPTLSNGRNPKFAVYSKSTVWTQSQLQNQCKRLSGLSYTADGTVGGASVACEFRSGLAWTSNYCCKTGINISYDNYSSQPTYSGPVFIMVLPRINLSNHYALCWNVC